MAGKVAGKINEKFSKSDRVEMVPEMQMDEIKEEEFDLE